MKKALIDFIAEKKSIANKDLIEKDINLHRLLLYLTRNREFASKYAFKGGTCLTKCYFGYYRFSEDIDFSYIPQDEFIGKSQKELRRMISKKADFLMGLLEQHAHESSLEFKAKKQDSHYVELGGSNKFTTFKVWYQSAVSGVQQFIKVQINFLEYFAYPLQERVASSLLSGIDKKEFTFLFPEEPTLTESIKVRCYSHEEILLEKVRAILTRKGVKSRGFIDVFILTKGDISMIKSCEKEIILKIRFMLRYEKYIQNLKDFRLEEFVMGEEDKLMLTPLAKGFHDFLPKFHELLNQLADKVKQA